MEQELLTELSTIKMLLWVILTLIVSFIIFYFTRNALANIQRLETMRREQFCSIAQSLEDQGKYDELKDEAQSRIDKYPKDVLAWWYFALSQYKSGELGAALLSFSELNTIDPAWEKETVAEYIEDIRNSMSGPGGVNT